MTVGAELAQARQRLGLTIDEVSARTKINPERLSAIEHMDLERLPALVYLKGFLHAYATEVQLDPDDIANRYLNEVEIASAASVPPATNAAGAADDSALDEFHSETTFDEKAIANEEEPVFSSQPVVQQAAQPREPPPPPTTDRLFVPFAERELERVRKHAAHSGYRSAARYGLLVLVTALAVAAGWLLAADYDTIASRFQQVTGAEPNGQAENSRPTSDTHAPAPPQSVSETAAQPNTKRAQANLNPPREPAPKETRASTRARAAAAAAPSAPARDRAGRSNAPASGLASEPRGEHAAERANATGAATSDAERTERSVAAKARESSNRDLSGSWALTNRVESSSYGPFQSLNLGFHLQLQQRGNRVTGTGQKWMENGQRLPAGRRTPIRIEGTLNGRRLELIFTERGAKRSSAGTFVLDVEEDGTLRGTFASDAAQAQGTSLARRMDSPR